jgi:ABC-type lipoprotein export system ATPase subunit
MERYFDLIAQNATKKFSHKKEQIEVLKGITQTFHAQKTYAIMGPSGTGKSTLMHLLAGIDCPTSGTITLGGQNLSTLAPQDRARTIGFVFQNPSLIRELCVLENIILAGTVVGKTVQESENLAKELLVAVGLEQTASWQIGQLSGGQRQRVALARALLNKPAFLLADELTGNLDHEMSFALIRLLLALQKEWKMGLVLSSHNDQIANMMELVFLLKDGNLVNAHDYYPERKSNESGSRA